MNPVSSALFAFATVAVATGAFFIAHDLAHLPVETSLYISLSVVIVIVIGAIIKNRSRTLYRENLENSQQVN